MDDITHEKRPPPLMACDHCSNAPPLWSCSCGVRLCHSCTRACPECGKPRDEIVVCTHPSTRRRKQCSRNAL